MKAQKYFFTLTEARRAEITTDAGLYCVRFPDGVTADRLFRAGDFALDEARVFTDGQKRLYAVKRVNGKHRFFPLRETLPEGKAYFENRSFAIDALNTMGALFRGVSLPCADTPICWCATCGSLFSDEVGRDHDCTVARCESCGCALPDEVARAGHILCEDCARRVAGNLNGYHGRPNRARPAFEKPNKRLDFCHFGGEMEVDGSDGLRSKTASFCKQANDILNAGNYWTPFVAFETDSSINGGVECITQPYTLNGFNAKREALARFYDLAREKGGNFGKNNGLHIHVDRAFFGEESFRASVYMELFVYKYYDFFKHISGRDSGKFGYAKKKEVKDLVTATYKADEHDHFNAVNVSSKTIEVRIFGGHIDNADDFLAVIDIVNALANWAKKTDERGAIVATPKSLVRFIKNPARVLCYLESIKAKASQFRLTDDALKEYKLFVATLTAKASK